MVIFRERALFILGVAAFLPLPAMSQRAPLLASAFFEPGNSDHMGTRSLVNVGGVRGFQGLVRFDLTTLRAGAAGLSNATLRLFVNKVSQAGSVDIFSAGGPWNEATGTGTEFPVPVHLVAGGVSVAAADTYIEVQVTDQVQNWLGGDPNYGFLIVAHRFGTTVSFEGKDLSVTNHPPELKTDFAFATAGITSGAPFITATTKGPNQINLAWSGPSNPSYGYLIEIQSAADARYLTWTEWRPVPMATGYTCDPSVIINGAVCNISDPNGIHIYRPPTNGVPYWVTDSTYIDPQDGTAAQFIAHGLKTNTSYTFRVRTYTGNTSPAYGAYSNVASATTSAYALRYVSMTGADANDGTGSDDAHAWKSLSRASTLSCGQALIAMAGTYGGMWLSQSCSAAGKVVVMADPGALVTLAGPVGIGGHSIVLDGLRVRAALGGGDYVLVMGGSNSAMLGMDVAPPTIPQSGYNGVQLLNGKANLIYGSYLHDFGSPDATQNPGGNGGFILDAVNSSASVIWSNHFTRGGHDTSLCKGGCQNNRWLNNVMDGGWSTGWEAIEESTGNLLEGGVIFDPGQLVTAYKPGLETSSAYNTIRRNLVINAKFGAVEVSAIEGCDTVISSHIYNNTFIHPGSCLYESSNGGEAKYADLIFSNNICYKTTQAESGFGIMYSRNPASQISYNSVEYIDANDLLQTEVKLVRYYGGSEYPTTLALADRSASYSPPFSNNLALSAVRPQFVDEFAGDFHLSITSPMRNAGVGITAPGWGSTAGAVDLGAFGINLAGSQSVNSKSNVAVSESHTGNFTQGQQGAAYNVTVSNGATAGSTAGTVTLIQTLPIGLTLVSMSGTGWSCIGGTCTRSDALNAGASYPTVTVTVNVKANAGIALTAQVSVSGGGSATATSSDDTVIIARRPTRGQH